MTLSKQHIMAAMICSTLSLTSMQANSDENLVKSIMKLRGEVESLYRKIDDNKEMHKSQMKSYAMQKADAEAQINRQETSIKQLESQINKVREQIAKASHKNEDIKPILLKAIEDLTDNIQAGIPFKTKARTAELAKIKEQLTSNSITPEKGLSLVWASYDDALRLTKENGLFKQNITVGGKEKLCQIAKLGTIAMFFATPDESVGYAVKTDNGYTYKIEQDKEQRKKIVALFDAFQKQIRTGYFSLPNALIVMEKN